MRQLILAANELPVEIQTSSEGFNIKPSAELKFSGLRNFYQEHKAQWVGQIDETILPLSPDDTNVLQYRLAEFKCYPVFPDPEDHQDYLYGFSGNTLWPLFHYFPQNTIYDNISWESYVKVNKLYAEKIIPLLKDDDILWIHDFHLLLLPKMIREKHPRVSIGLFVHIPFPSFEVFRLLPWRIEILEGMLGADLIGFQVFDYVRHMMSCVRRLLGHDTIFNRISIGERILKVDAFPKGIDYSLFVDEVSKLNTLGGGKLSHVFSGFKKHISEKKGKKFILSIDPMDYTKGIPQRLKAFEMFLSLYPEFIEKVVLLMITQPSEKVGQPNEEIFREVNELVGQINGQYGTLTWAPVVYINRNLSFDELVGIYAYSDIALIVPFRDGMNLVAKEYVASRINGTGVLILSELAGASKELHQAIIVNPNNLTEIAEAIKQAMEMPEDEQIERNGVMNKRLKKYPISRWATEFVTSLEGVKNLQQTKLTRKLKIPKIKQIQEAYATASKRILFLDYDGTLSGFRKNPEDARPDQALYDILNKLTGDGKNTVVIISGRDKETLDRWFQKNNHLQFIAEHGVWMKDLVTGWFMMEQIENNWKEAVYPLLDFYVDQTPKTSIEEKNFSLVWHYRKADPDLGEQRAWELKEQLRSLTANLNLEIMDGDKVLEIKYSGINKGKAALQKMGDIPYDFILAIGDDWTDEYTFEAMPAKAFTIRVGTKTTQAGFYVETVNEIRSLLNGFTDGSLKL